MAHTVYIRFKVFWTFSKLLFVGLILTFFEITTPVMRIMLTIANTVQIIISDMAHSVYNIDRVFKLFECAVCSAHIHFFKISTPMMRIMLTMAK